jgi:hypothetical protein
MADETIAYTEPTREWHSMGDNKRVFTECLTNHIFVKKVWLASSGQSEIRRFCARGRTMCIVRAHVEASRGHLKCATAAEANQIMLSVVKSDRSALSDIERRLIRVER